MPPDELKNMFRNSLEKTIGKHITTDTVRGWAEKKAEQEAEEKKKQEEDKRIAKAKYDLLWKNYKDCLDKTIAWNHAGKCFLCGGEYGDELCNSYGQTSRFIEKSSKRYKMCNTCGKVNDSNIDWKSITEFSEACWVGINRDKYGYPADFRYVGFDTSIEAINELLDEYNSLQSKLNQGLPMAQIYAQNIYSYNESWKRVKPRSPVVKNISSLLYVVATATLLFGIVAYLLSTGYLYFGINLLSPLIFFVPYFIGISKLNRRGNKIILAIMLVWSAYAVLAGPIFGVSNFPFGYNQAQVPHEFMNAQGEMIYRNRIENYWGYSIDAIYMLIHGICTATAALLSCKKR